MHRFRITITNSPDRAEQLRLASRIRQELIERTRVSLASDYPLPGVHRDEQGRAYLEFATNDLNRIRQVLHEGGHDQHAALSEPRDPLGEPCASCGNVAGPVLPAICPNCGFREITPCPVCQQLNPRSSYEHVSGNLFLCPTPLEGARHRVRFTYNEPMFNPDGTYHQPFIVILEAEPL